MPMETASTVTIGGSGMGDQGRGPPGPKSLHFHALFGEKIDQMIGWRPHLRAWRHPVGYPGPATGDLLGKPTNTFTNLSSLICGQLRNVQQR